MEESKEFTKCNIFDDIWIDCSTFLDEIINDSDFTGRNIFDDTLLAYDIFTGNIKFEDFTIKR